MSNTPSTPSALRFTGDGSLTVRGIPSRDLTSEDLAGLGGINVQKALISGLYEAASKTAATEINRTDVEGDGAPGSEPTAPASAAKDR